MRRLDDIYHDTVSRVLGCLATLPDLTQQHPSLVSLITSLKLESAREAADITDEDGNNEDNNLNGHVGKMTTSLLTSFPNSREMENMNVMSKSQGVIESNTNLMNKGLSQSIKSDPGLIKSAVFSKLKSNIVPSTFRQGSECKPKLVNIPRLHTE